MSFVKPHAILIHRSEAGFTGAEVKEVERAQGQGYHYFVRRSGVVDQLYEWGEPVWHALKWSRCCVGVAVFGDFDPCERSRNGTPTAEQLQATTRLCADLFRRWGTMPVLGHTDLPHATKFPNKRCPGIYLDTRAIERDALVLFAGPSSTEEPAT